MFNVVSIICDCPWIESWVKHYISLGFDNIFIYDDGLTDQQRKSLVKYRQVQLLKINYKSDEVQLDCYREFMNYVPIGTYNLLIDDDEYLILNNHNTIKDYVKSLPDFDEVIFNWLMRNSLQVDHANRAVYESDKSYYVKSLYHKKSNIDYNNIDQHWIGNNDTKVLYSTGEVISEMIPARYIQYDYSNAFILHDYIQGLRHLMTKYTRGYKLCINNIKVYTSDLKECTDYWINLFNKYQDTLYLSELSYFESKFVEAMESNDVEIDYSKVSIREINLLVCVTYTFNKKLTIIK